MSSRLALLSAASALLIYVPVPAQAAIDAQGAEQLKTLIQGYIDEQKQIGAATGSEITTEGDLTVTPKDNYYEVVTPHFKTKYPGDMIYDLGKIAVNVMPTDDPDAWKISYSLPSPISFKNNEGKTLGTINLGPQKTGGLWNSKLGYLTKLNATYGKIEFTGSADEGGEPAKGSIGEILIVQNLVEDKASGKWSGPINATAKNITVGGATQNIVTLNEARVDYTISGMDALPIKAIREQFKDMGKSGESVTDIQNNPQQILKVFDVMGSMFESAMGKVDSKFSINGLTVNAPAPDSPEKVTAFSLANAYWGMNIDQTTPPNSGLGMSFGMSGLKIDAAEYAQFIPDNFDLDIKVDNFPMAEIMKIAKEQASAQLADPQSQTAPTVPNFPAMLAQAGSSVTNKLNISAAAYKVTGSGETKANSTSMMGFTTDQNLSIEGLDAVIAEVNKQAETNPELKQSTGPLTMLQMMGQQDQNNPSLRTYHLIVDEQGKATMNGSDLSSIMGGGMAPPASDVPATE